MTSEADGTNYSNRPLYQRRGVAIADARCGVDDTGPGNVVEHNGSQIGASERLRRVGEQQEEKIALCMASAHLPELVADRHQQVDDPLVVAFSVGDRGLGGGDHGGQVSRPKGALVGNGEFTHRGN